MPHAGAEILYEKADMSGFSKQKYHFDRIFVTGCTGRFQNDKLLMQPGIKNSLNYISASGSSHCKSLPLLHAQAFAAGLGPGIRADLRHSEAETKWPQLFSRHFQTPFPECNIRISIQFLLKCVPKGPVNNDQALVQMMAWRRSGDKPLSEPMIAYLTDVYKHHSASVS